MGFDWVLDIEQRIYTKTLSSEEKQHKPSPSHLAARFSRKTPL